MNDNFGEWPPSITELRAARSESPEDWTPRDALLSLLREIDSGKLKPRHMIICFSEEREEEDGLAIGDSWVQAGKANAHEQIGLLQSAIMGMWHTNR